MSEINKQENGFVDIILAIVVIGVQLILWFVWKYYVEDWHGGGSPPHRHRH